MSALKPDTLPQGAPFAIGAAIVYALRSEPSLAGATVLDNPKRASDLQTGSRIVFFEDQADKPIAQPGQSQKRTYGFTLGVINRTDNDRQGAHADYRAAKRAVRNCLPAINTLVRLEGRGMVEGDVLYRLENLDVGGGLVLGLFTVDYRDPG
ncbi:MAG: hypothetical protein LWW96_14315 [Acidovorax sp.]|uniref:hypothetical protein n=1 Tax=Acidovorax sp. TaxID=1872122 RepID=UPI0025C494B3|nr:hypothetical protein [Acidovorax sp.]MCE1193317.1 hypothetical protein [Acidovorax sp.]